MTDLTSSSQQGRKSTINLVRSSHPWTEADSAAGYVLKYIVPMRRILTDVVGSQEVADGALKLLLGHLVSAGFGDQKSGKLRDFLVRGVRSAAKTAVADLPDDKRPDLNLDVATLESKTWLTYWREGLLERAWRALERLEHSSTDKPYYTVLFSATSGEAKTTPALVEKIHGEIGQKLDEATVQQFLTESRTMFAQMIADEVAETIKSPTSEDVKREIALLGLSKAFSGITV
ncbi:hypothetical protein LF1_29030 [Rubripirellula obstinata]|uniref:Uncharacterized protein n=1 Tax=Rubripirellula obstinata TaxID=406547 RepID=A0A5B1CLZ0_9BACT|nr:hypothetical protein [Rubripirellula obstinata]KAA1260363.1 hypothetical protein LF1_29030 [Rubripirellula obstinata]